MVGIDPILGLGQNFHLFPYILEYLAEIGYFTLANIKRYKWMNKESSYWYTTKDMGIVGEFANEWEDYTRKPSCWMQTY